MILVTAYPLRLRDEPELSNAFTRILTKPLNLQDLRQTIEAALASAAVPTASEPSAALSDVPSQAAEDHSGGSELSKALVPVPTTGRSRFVVAAALVALACVLLVLILPALGLPSPLDWFNKPPTPVASAAEDNPTSALPVQGDPNAVELGQEVKDRLAIQAAQVEAPKQGRQLTLSGSLNFDPDLLAQVHPARSQIP